MRNTILAVLALVACALLSFMPSSARATTVNVNIEACTPSPSPGKCAAGTTWSDSGVTFAGWEFNSSNGDYEAADLTYKNDSGGETGLGVACTYATSSKCDQDEVNATPFQYISVDISGIVFDKLSVGTGSDDTNGNSDDGTVPETAYVYGCSAGVPGNCTSGAILASHPGANAPGNTFTFDFTKAQLSGFRFLLFTPLCETGLSGSPATCPDAPDANVLLSSLSYTTSVPEPGTLGLFGLGIVLLGGFAGLRRCKQH